MARLHVGMTCTTSVVLHGVFIIVNRDDDHLRRGKKKNVSERVEDGYDDTQFLHGHAHRCSEISLKVAEKQQAGTSYRSALLLKLQ